MKLGRTSDLEFRRELTRLSGDEIKTEMTPSKFKDALQHIVDNYTVDGDEPAEITRDLTNESFLAVVLDNQRVSDIKDVFDNDLEEDFEYSLQPVEEDTNIDVQIPTLISTSKDIEKFDFSCESETLGFEMVDKEKVGSVWAINCEIKQTPDSTGENDCLIKENNTQDDFKVKATIVSEE